MKTASAWSSARPTPVHARVAQDARSPRPLSRSCLLPLLAVRCLAPTRAHRVIEIKKNRFDGELGVIPLNFHRESQCYVEGGSGSEPSPLTMAKSDSAHTYVYD